jgi:hypothetical protein
MNWIILRLAKRPRDTYLGRMSFEFCIPTKATSVAAIFLMPIAASAKCGSVAASGSLWRTDAIVSCWTDFAVSTASRRSAPQ